MNNGIKVVGFFATFKNNVVKLILHLALIYWENLALDQIWESFGHPLL